MIGRLMANPTNLYFRLGAINMALAVGLGAFGAHGLKARTNDPYYLQTWQTGAQYHFLHALGLIAISQMKRKHHLVGGLFLGGILLFSGSLYTLVLTQNKKLGAITPIGGVSFIAGWIVMAVFGLL
ncbi:hypothetical protein ABK040_001944 [Willaertia magna]